MVAEYTVVKVADEVAEQIGRDADADTTEFVLTIPPNIIATDWAAFVALVKHTVTEDTVDTFAMHTTQAKCKSSGRIKRVELHETSSELYTAAMSILLLS